MDGKTKLLVRYVCYSRDSCGFDVDTYAENCHAYVSIIRHAQMYLLWLTRERCECRQRTRGIVERVTAGQIPSNQPPNERTIHLENELQLMYVCDEGRCDYKKSIPQIKVQQTTIKCACDRKCIYHPDKRIYSCLFVDGGCGVCFHELDSLTYMHTMLAKDEREDSD